MVFAWFLWSKYDPTRSPEWVDVVILAPKGIEAGSLRPHEIISTQRKKQATKPEIAEIQNSQISGRENGQTLSAERQYTYEIRQLIEQQKIYPTMAKRLRQEGRVVVRFRLRPDGSVISAEVVEGSPYETLNRAAQELVRNLDGARPFPQVVHKTAWDFVIPIDYKM